MQPIDRMVVWNRTEGDLSKRMNHFRVRVLDASRNILYEEVIDPAPNPSREISLRVQLGKPEAGCGGQREPVASPFRQSGRASPLEPIPDLRRPRSASVVANQVVPRDVNWIVTKPTQVTPASGRSFTVQADGSYLVAAGADALTCRCCPIPPDPSGSKPRMFPGQIRSPRPLSRITALRRSACHARNPAACRAATCGSICRVTAASFLDNRPIQSAKCSTWRSSRFFVAMTTSRCGKRPGSPASMTVLDYPWTAVDGNTTGNDRTNSYAHTQLGLKEAWWEVDLGSEQGIDRMVVWNRAEGDYYQRMNHFRVRILDQSRQVVFEQVIDEVPNPSRDRLPEPVCGRVGGGEPSKSQWSLRLDKDGGVDPGGRFRISSTQRARSAGAGGSRRRGGESRCPSRGWPPPMT